MIRGRNWSDKDFATLRDMTAAGKSAADIAAVIKRGTYAVQKMRQKMKGIMVPNYARVVNEQPWEPLPNMVKRRCEMCQFWFATPHMAQRGRCPDCRGMEDY